MTMDIDSTNNASNKAEEEEERKISVHPVREKKRKHETRSGKGTETRSNLRVAIIFAEASQRMISLPIERKAN
jgi:hypothetical protein